jgi:hypothetical protein
MAQNPSAYPETLPHMTLNPEFAIENREYNESFGHKRFSNSSTYHLLGMPPRCATFSVSKDLSSSSIPIAKSGLKVSS